MSSEKHLRQYAGVGLWILVAGLVVSITIFIIIAITGAVSRGQIVIALLGLVVVVVIYITGLGWSFTGAVKRANKITT